MKKVFVLLLSAVLLIAASVSLGSCEWLSGKATTVVFDNGIEGVQNTSFEVKDFSEITVPDDPKREGYLFGGWYFDAEYNEQFTLSALFDKGEGGTVTVYAKWTEYSELEFEYKLYLDGSAYDTLTLKGLTIAGIANPEKKDHAFLGWYADPEFKNEFTDASVSVEDYGKTTALYAKMIPFSECEYKITFTVDGEKYVTIVTDGLSYALPNQPEKEGFVFDGWYLAGDVALTAEALKSFKPSETVAVSARWKKVDPKEYKLEFYSDGVLLETQYTKDGKFTEPESPEKTGFDFDGWYLAGDVALTADALSAYTPGSSITVNARWKALPVPEYKVELYVNDNLWQTKYTTQGKLVPPTPPAKDHCTFDGWFYDKAFKYAFDEDDKIETNKKLYAKYSPMQIIATLHMPDGTLKSYKISYGESYSLTKIGIDRVNKMLFIGWKLKDTDTMLTDGEGKSLESSLFEEDIEVEPVLRAYSCELTVFPNGEGKAGYTVYAFDGELETSIPDPVPSEAGMIFDGWYIKQNGNRVDVDLDTYDFSGSSISVYARIITEKIIIATDGSLNPALKFTMTEQAHYYTYNSVWDLIYYMRDEIQVGMYHEPQYESGSNSSNIEIIIGADAKYREEECCISSSELISKGYVIKAVGDKIVIAGATDALTAEAFDRFVSDILGITVGSGNKIDDISVARDIYITKDFPVKSASIAGKSIEDFVIVGDESLQQDFGILYDVRDAIYDRYPALLDVKYSGTESGYTNRIIIILGDIPEDANGDGFVVTVSEGNLYIKCAYSNALCDSVLGFVNNNLLKTENNTLAEGYKYTKRVSVVTYEQFGAVGNGVHDDFLAIKAAHEYANAGGQRVEGRSGASYFIGSDFTESIPVKTDVNFGGAVFFIDDMGIAAYKNRLLPLFVIEGETTSLSVSVLEASFGTLRIRRGDTNIPWLAGKFEGEKMVIVTSAEQEFLTYNSSVPSYRTEAFIVDGNGNIIGGGALLDLPGITSVEIVGGCDGITVENGIFKTLAPAVNSMTDGKNRNHSYYRGIMIRNAGNVTLKGITHYVLNEVPMNSKYGTGSESYPYAGFIIANDCYDLTLENLTLFAHMQYYTSSATSSSSGTVTYTAMPSYDIWLSNCVNVTVRNLKQQSEQSLTDSKYARIMYAARVKNLSVSNSEFNSIKLWYSMGASFTDTKIGTGVNVFGFGDLVFERVTRLVGNVFITLPYENGATLAGNLVFKDCVMVAAKTYNSIEAAQASGYAADSYLVYSTFKTTDSKYLDWYFGFDTALPKNITVESITSNSEGVYVFYNINNAAFDEENENCYGITEKITFIDMDALPIVKNTYASTVLASITVQIQ